MLKMHGIKLERRRVGRPAGGATVSEIPAPLRDNPDILEKDEEYWKTLGFTFDPAERQKENHEEFKLTAQQRKAIRRRRKCNFPTFA